MPHQEGIGQLKLVLFGDVFPDVLLDFIMLKDKVVKGNYQCFFCRHESILP